MYVTFAWFIGAIVILEFLDFTSADITKSHCHSKIVQQIKMITNIILTKYVNAQIHEYIMNKQCNDQSVSSKHNVPQAGFSGSKSTLCSDDQ